MARTREGFKHKDRDLKVEATALLNGNRLGQIAGLVYVPVSEQGDVVGKHLQRNREEQRYEVLRGIRYVQRVVHISGQLGITLCQHRENTALPSFNLFDVVGHFVV